MSSDDVIKVRRDDLMACMTCPICNKLLKHATTIPECLHTFCRKCIRKKISDEELECCPICNIDLGCVPLEKLRADHNLQDVRTKIFPYKRQRGIPEIVAPVTLPSRRKERSLSSLVVNTPKVSTQTPLTGKRSKFTSRKKSRGSSFNYEKRAKKVEDSQESSSSRENSNRINHNSKQDSSSAEPSNRPQSDKEKEDGQPWDGKVDWKPLNDLVEAANRSKSSKLISQASIPKSEPKCVPKSKGKDPLQRPKVQDNRHEADDATESSKPNKKRRYRKKKDGELRDSDVTSTQAMADIGGGNGGWEKKTHPIWFQLVPFEEQGGEEPLRQIEGRYVKLNDGNVPISIIQKLVMNKLELPSEIEVELRCMGRPVVPSLQLCNLMEQWLQAHPDTIRAQTGSSAHEFVMKISYAKKSPAPALTMVGGPTNAMIYEPKQAM